VALAGTGKPAVSLMAWSPELWAEGRKSELKNLWKAGICEIPLHVFSLSRRVGQAGGLHPGTGRLLKATREGVSLPVLAYKPKTFVLICQGPFFTHFSPPRTPELVYTGWDNFIRIYAPQDAKHER
jgi:hypothetical protein